MTKKFVHLHLHTEYSLLDGFTKTDKLFDRLKELEMDTVAITDHGSMFGVLEFYKKAKKAGIKPIIGCEVYVSNGSRFRKDPSLDKNMGHLVLLAKDKKGYENLSIIVSRGYKEGYYYRPRIDFELLSEFNEGLIVLSSCLNGEIAKLLANDDYSNAKETALRYLNIFGKENYYLELQYHGLDIQKKVNDYLVRLSSETGIELVATNDVHYLKKEDSFLHDVLLCIQTGKRISESERLRFPTKEFYLKSYEEMNMLFTHIPKAIENTVKIAQMIDFDFNFNEMHLPSFSKDSITIKSKLLREKCIVGLKNKYSDSEMLYERLNYELNTISRMGFDDYFLIVSDFIDYARNQGIYVGAGRGSVGGSLVAYSLGITQVDPIEYGLIFERFLNPNRISMPDIDIDFEDARRQEVIDYVVEKYGYNNVAQIATFGTFGARAVVRDVGRVLDISYSRVDQIAKLIPNRLGINLKRALTDSEKLKKEYDQDSQIKQLIDIGMELEGLPRHVSTHAAGIVITDDPIERLVPLYSQENIISTQFSMNNLEELGLLKMDFLGLRNLTIIKDTVNMIKKSNPLFDIDLIPINDKNVYDLISTGFNLGVFQLESSGMRSFMKELKPKNIEDIIAGISLYRPGPMDSIPKFIKNRKDPSLVEYMHPILKDILDVTYGVIVYQEQVMEIVRKAAGYTYGRSDLVRKAMSKKKREVILKEKHNFIYGLYEEGENGKVKGCKNILGDESICEKLFDQMEDFANYAFNKSHAAGYSIIAYQTAYLKTYFKKEFMSSLISSVMGHQGKLGEYLDECKRLGIEVLVPDINESFEDFTPTQKGIRFGLIAIKNVGKSFCQNIINERENGQYIDFDDFVKRLTGKDLNKKAVESMIKAGVFDSLGFSRRYLLSTFEKSIDKLTSGKKNLNQMSFLEIVSLESDEETNVEKDKEFEKRYLLEFEKEVLGIYISGHPLEEFSSIIKSNTTHSITEFLNIKEESTKSISTICGNIMKVVVKGTKDNKKMAFVEIEDMYEKIEIVVFAKFYERFKDILEEGKTVLVTGRPSFKEEENNKMICDKIRVLDGKSYSMFKKMYVKIGDDNKNTLITIKNILKTYFGTEEVILYIYSQNKSFKMENVDINNSELQQKLIKLVGKENLVFK